MKRSAVLAFLVLIAAAVAVAQMGGGHMGGSGGGMTAPMAGGMGHELTIGADGTAYVLDPDTTDTNNVRTAVLAIAATGTAPTAWRVNVAGLAHDVAAGTDRVVVAAITASMFGSTTRGSTTPTITSKLYFLNSATGAEVRSVTIDGMANSVEVRKVNNADLVYVVVRTNGTSTTPRGVKLFIYRIDGTVVKGVDLANDITLEVESEGPVE